MSTTTATVATGGGGSGTTLCALCSTTLARYKCPACLIPYCSLVCYKPHKSTHETTDANTPNSSSINPPPSSSQPPCSSSPRQKPSDTPSSSLTSLPLLSSPHPTTLPSHLSQLHPPPPLLTTTPDTDDPLSPLLHHPRLTNFILANPKLHNLLYSIYLSILEPPSPPSPTLTTLTPSLLKLKKRSSTRPWTPDVGIQRGVRRLNRVRGGAKGAAAIAIANAAALGGVGGTTGGTVVRGGLLDEFITMVLECVEVGKVQQQQREQEREAVKREQLAEGRDVDEGEGGDESGIDEVIDMS